jgi:catechol 2,3-dioxygenase
MTRPARTVKGLGEIALRVSDLDKMQRFYSEVVGLELLRRFENAAFFKVAEGFGGHAQVLVLFDRSSRPGYSGLDAAKTTVDHIAFEIALADYETEKRRLEQLGMTVTTAEHAWVRWRSLYVTDPEGNEVEFVCYDAGVSGC